jgi:hypothetical protein
VADQGMNHFGMISDVLYAARGLRGSSEISCTNLA